MEEEEKNNEQGFIKEQTNKLKEKGKEEAKKQIKKKIMAFVMAHLPIILYTILAIMALTIIIVLLAGFLKIIGKNKVEKTSDAKELAISYALGTGTGENDDDNSSAIKISYNNGKYIISNNYSDEDIENIKSEISITGKDISDFTDFEIGIIGGLMENGLNVDDYTVEQLKCLPLFIKAEGCTRYLDLRPNSEKFDSQGNYKPQKLEDLKENEVPGVILVQRTNTKEGGSRPLEYIDLNSFNEMQMEAFQAVSEDDLDILNYFTIDENNNLLVAKWEYIKIEVEGVYPSGVARVSPKEEFTIKIESIPYSRYVKKYTMPFDFLVQLLVTTDEADFCKELTDITLDSKILINIQETETKTITEEEKTYTTYRKEEQIINYDIDLSIEREDGSTSTSSHSDSESSTAETSQTYNVKEKTTAITHEYTFEIKEADIWLAHYLKQYKQLSKVEIQEGPNETEILGTYGIPSVTVNVPNSNNTAVKQFESRKESNFSHSIYDSVECSVSEIQTSVYTKMDEKRITTTQIEKYPSDPNPTTNTHIYGRDENENLEKFLLIYDKYEYTRAMMDSISAWLFDMMESNDNTIDLVDPIKYLLYLYDGTDHGVTELDLSIFEPDKFISATNSKGIIVKTDESMAIKTLEKKEIEEVINKNFSGQRKENLLSAIDGLMYIQNTYHVNAVFAIAVTKAESGCGTNWATIDSSTYNWCSMKGSYNGNSYTDSSGTNWRKYSSFDEAIRDFGDWIATSSYYFKAGKYTPYDIGPTYCDAAWGEEVAKYIKGMYESIGVSIYVSGGNDLQQKVVEVANNSASYGITAEKDYCQAWVSDVYYRAGANNQFAHACCAVHAGSQWGVSTDFSKIQVGATVYGYVNRSDIPNYGHVGIYIGDGIVAHNVGGVKFDDLDYWITRYDGVCWGWNGGTDLTGGSYPCKTGLMTANH